MCTAELYGQALLSYFQLLAHLVDSQMRISWHRPARSHRSHARMFRPVLPRCMTSATMTSAYRTHAVCISCHKST